jgi:hypothetical protein
MSWALRAFWAAWAVALLLGLWVQMRPAAETVLGAYPNHGVRLFIVLVFAALLLMLTPKFLGSLIAAVMLVLVARRVAWSRWVLLVGLAASIVALAGEGRHILLTGGLLSSPALFFLRVALLVVMGVATAQLFSASSTDWLKGRTRDT